MKRQKAVALAGCLVVGMLLGFANRPANAYKDGETRKAKTSQLMKGLVGSNCGALKKSLEAEEPDWEAISLHAALLNEAGYLLMADKRCPDGEWAGGAKTLQEQGAALVDAAEAKDIDAAKTAFGALTSQGCAKCHMAHKGK